VFLDLDSGVIIAASVLTEEGAACAAPFLRGDGLQRQAVGRRGLVWCDRKGEAVLCLCCVPLVTLMLGELVGLCDRAIARWIYAFGLCHGSPAPPRQKSNTLCTLSRKTASFVRGRPESGLMLILNL
jgi:hypothetical protein